MHRASEGQQDVRSSMPPYCVQEMYLPSAAMTVVFLNAAIWILVKDVPTKADFRKHLAPMMSTVGKTCAQEHASVARVFNGCL
jgi:hypothetical protein